MIPFDQLIEKLGYNESSHYKTIDNPPASENAHIFRIAKEAGVKGIYFFETSPNDGQKILSNHPAVYVAETDIVETAREIHRKLWNLSYVPFLIVRLPQQIRIYNGFNYSSQPHEEGLIDSADNLRKLNNILKYLNKDSIDTGKLWSSYYGEKLNPNQRVDTRLLKNLEQLGQALENDGLNSKLAHALIGKYVYFRYLKDRGILTDEWLLEQNIKPDDIFTLKADIENLQKLVNVLDNRLNGKIFPIDFKEIETLKNKHVSWVASVFSGSKIIQTAPDIVHQLHIPFKAYDFHFIPVETFSAIYEQFIENRKEKGAVYTPEVLADYLISEMSWAKKLKNGMKILDPACGSGVFLVLIFRRLIEKEIHRKKGRKLNPPELCEILRNVYGVERERDACYVTEFSLILTLLNYVEPRDLQKLKFQLPDLHNSQIFESDFFDIEGKHYAAKFWQKGLKFDWIVGNPPWIRLKQNSDKEHHAIEWVNSSINKSEKPIGNQIAEAYSWLASDLLNKNGIVGFILPSTSLFNIGSKDFRKKFFLKHEVLRVTNFANLRNVLFGKGKSGVLPASTIIYNQTEDYSEKKYIVHYSPFSINQIYGIKTKPWVITINENEIKTVSPYQAEKGETITWKLALWGTYRDKRAIERINSLFPVKLKTICNKRNWSFKRGAELKNINKYSNDYLEHIPEIEGKRRLRADLMNKSLFQMFASDSVLEQIPNEMCYIRKQGGELGKNVINAPHIIISPVWTNYILYSNIDFLLPPKHIGIASNKNDVEYLKALSIYLKSSLVAYFLFFNSHEWGVFRNAKWVTISEVSNIPTPELTNKQTNHLANLHKILVQDEEKEINGLLSYNNSMNLWYDNTNIRALTNSEKTEAKKLKKRLYHKFQNQIDNAIFDLFNIPADIQLLVRDFINIRLHLDNPSAIETVTQNPSSKDFLSYAQILRDELDNFTMGESYHSVSIKYSVEMTECIVEITDAKQKAPITERDIVQGDITLAIILSNLKENLREQFSQWIYVQRGLRFFEGPYIKIYKPSRLIDWTQTQALIDAGDIIGEVIANT